MTLLEFSVLGEPRPATGLVRRGRRDVPSNSAVLEPWLALVEAAARGAHDNRPAIRGAVDLRLQLRVPLLGGAPAKWARSSTWALPSAHGTCSSLGLGQAVLDALLSARVLLRSSQVVDVSVSKRWATSSARSGVTVVLERAGVPVESASGQLRVAM